MIGDIHGLLAFTTAHVDDMRTDLRQLVELESPPDDPAALEACAAWLANRARELTGGCVRSIAQAEGPHLEIVVGRTDEPPVLVIGHFDTVWPVGTLAARPYVDDGQVARGPGVFDMKAGLVQGLWAVAAFRAARGYPPNLELLFTSDEEVQSPRSRPVIEAAAPRVRAALVLEPSLAGALKTARKAIGRFIVTIRGRAAHAGLDPHLGRSAIVELARVIEFLHGLSDERTGTIVNVGLVDGGTRANVVAAEARAVVDVRASTEHEAQSVSRRIFGIRPTRDGIEIVVTGGFVRPPMERTPAIAALFARAREIGAELGLDLAETSSGGGSDGNFFASLGVPVLDGLGAVGGGAHATDEHVLIQTMPMRAALLAGLLETR